MVICYINKYMVHFDSIATFENISGTRSYFGSHILISPQFVTGFFFTKWR